MAKLIDKAQIKLAKELRENGESWPAIAKATGASERGLRYNASKNGWNNKGNKPKPALPANSNRRGKEVARLNDNDIKQLAELVKSQLANDIEASANALSGWQPNELDLPQLEKRERIAESVQKRAANLFNIGEEEKPVVNIAVLSQLPDSVNS